jgi:polyketide synthase PksJ
MLEHTASQFSDKTIVHISPRDGSENQQTYAQLHNESLMVAHLLLAKGWRPDDLCLFVLSDSRAFVTLFWACQLAGIVPAPLPPLQGNQADSLEADKIRHVAAMLRRPILFDSRDDKRARIMQTLATEASVPLLFADELLAEASLCLHPVRDLPTVTETDLVVVQYSSGSTGMPKGVELTHRNLIANIKAQIIGTQAEPDDVIISWLPYFHDFGLFWSHLSALYHGMKQVRMDPAHFARRPVLWLEKAQAHNATMTNAIPTALDHLITNIELKLKRGPLTGLDLSRLRAILIGAEMINAAACRRLVELLAPYGLCEQPFLTGYGLTETTMVATGVPWGIPLTTRRIDRRAMTENKLAIDAHPEAIDATEFTSVGHAVDFCSVRGVDEQRNELPPDHIGLIEITGENVSQGYYRNPEATKQVLRDGWLDSGDMGFIDKNGHLYITGRAKELIIVNGHNYYPYDLEQIALRVPNAECVFKHVTICGYWHPGRQQDEIALFYVPARLPKAEIEQTLASVNTRIANYAGFPLDRVVELANRDIPRTSSGKIMRRILTERLLGGRYADRPSPSEADSRALREERLKEPPTSPEAIHAALTELWQQVLNLDGHCFADHDHLFHLGSDSIKAALLQGRLEELFQLRLESNFAYQRPTFAEQVSYFVNRDHSLMPPASEMETILRTVVADTLEMAPEQIGVTHPLLRLCDDFQKMIDLLFEVRRVFELAPDAAVGGNTIRAMAADVARQIELGQPETQHRSFPLMNFQETLYFHLKGFVRNEPSRLSCFIFIDLALEGDIRAERLAYAFDHAIAEHAVLRAIIDESGERPHMRVLEHVTPFTLTTLDLRGIPPQEQEQRLTARGREVNDIRFDVARWPLFLCELYRVGDYAYRLLIHIDHLLVDGFSFMHLLEAVLVQYDREAAGLPALKRQTDTLEFRDYVLIERFRQRTRSYERDMAFQMGIFTDLPPKATLPFKRDPASIDPVVFDTHYQMLAADTVDKLNQIVRSHGISLNSLLLAAWFKLVNLWSNQNDLIINMPVFNREQYFAGARAVMGSFIDIFPVRIRTAFAEPLMSVARKVEHFTREMLRSPVSSIDLSRRLAERDGATAASMSNLIFSNSIGVYGGEFHQLNSGEHHQLKGIKVRRPHFRTGAPGTFIDLVLYDYEGETYINWNYIRDLMDPAFIETLAHQFGHLVDELCAANAANAPETPFTGEGLLLPHHRGQLQRLVAPATPYPDTTTLQAEIESIADTYAEATALTFEDERLSYAELDRQANRIAHALLGMASGRNQFVALLFNRSSEMLAAQLGVLKAGAAYVPIDPEVPQQRLNYLLRDCGARVLLTQARHLEAALEGDAALERIIMLDTAVLPADCPAVEAGALLLGGNFIDAQSEHRPETESGPDDLAYMIYTSGSTGEPKGVMVRHRNILNFLHWVQRYYSLGPDDQLALVTSYSFDMTLASNWASLMSGATLHILDDNKTRDVETLLRFISDKKITLLNITPSHFSLLASARAYLNLPPLPMVEGMRIMLGGETISRTDLNLWLEHYPGHRFINEYGPTEASVASSFFPIPVNAKNQVELDVIPIGCPLDNNRLYIVDGNNHLCLPGVAGELCIGGVGVAAGYHNKPERTAKSFVPDPFAGDRSLMYRTGDRTRLREDGNIEFLGREDHQVNLRGYRIETGEVEVTLRHHPDIAQSIVTTRPDTLGATQLVAFYTSTTDLPVEAEALREFMADTLPAYMVPAHFQHISTIPTTASGKADLKALPNVAFDNAPNPRYQAPRNAMEQQLASIWSELLGNRSIGIHDSFWSQGGDSLKAMRLIVRYREEGIEGFGLREVFAHDTIEKSAVFLANSSAVPPVDESMVVALASPPTATHRFVLFPYACGNASAFFELARHLPADAEILAVSPAEPSTSPLAVASIAELSGSIAGHLRTLPERPTVLVGYSYGGYLAFDTAKRLASAGTPCQHLAIVATNPPGVTTELDWIAINEDETILDYSQRVYGFDPEGLTTEELHDYLALLRQQTRSMVEYQFDTPLGATTPTTILTGDEEEDPDIRNNTDAWRGVVPHARFATLPGRHMLIKSHPRALASQLSALPGNELPGLRKL